MRTRLKIQPGDAPIQVTVKTSAQRYFRSLKDEETVFLMWGVDGVQSQSGWTAFAFPESQFRIRSREPFVTRLCGRKVVISDTERMADLDGRVLSYERGRLRLT